MRIPSRKMVRWEVFVFLPGKQRQHPAGLGMWEWTASRKYSSGLRKRNIAGEDVKEKQPIQIFIYLSHPPISCNPMIADAIAPYTHVNQSHTLPQKTSHAHRSVQTLNTSSPETCPDTLRPLHMIESYLSLSQPLTAQQHQLPSQTLPISTQKPHPLTSSRRKLIDLRSIRGEARREVRSKHVVDLLNPDWCS